MTYQELYNQACEWDGSCMVCKVSIPSEYDFHEDDSDDYEIVMISPDDQRPPRTIYWDWFFTDEAECFDFERFGITPPKEF